MMRTLAAFIVLGLLAPNSSKAMPAVWTVRDKDSTIVLFGSIHLLPRGLAWQSPTLRRALARADDVWFELPANASPDAFRSAMAVGLNAEWEPALTECVPPERRAAWLKALETLNLDRLRVDRMKPWLASLVLSVAMVAQTGANGSDGVERALESKIPPRVERRAFETLDQQLALFTQTSPTDQMAMLMETLDEVEQSDSTYPKLVRAWLDGDLATLDQLSLRPMKQSSPRLFQKLVTERNRRWVDRLSHRMAGKGTTVVIVGAAHMLGPVGLPALLRGRGFHVEGPKTD